MHVKNPKTHCHPSFLRRPRLPRRRRRRLAARRPSAARRKNKDGVELLAGKSRIRITQVHDGVLRVRVAKDGTFPKDFSWALADVHLDFKEALSPVQVDDGKSETKISAGRVVVLIKKSPLLISFA